MSTTQATFTSTESGSRLNWLNLNLGLAVLIAALSVLTAYAAYRSAEIDSNSTDHFFIAQGHLNDANTLFLEQGQEITYDFSTYDSYIANQEVNPDISEYYFEQLSEAALASMKRESGPFDQAYYDAMYAEANAMLDEEAAAFDIAAHDSNRAVAYQLTVLIMAVGLSFAAWASLSEAQQSLRLTFALLAVVTLIIGLGQMFSIPGGLS